MKHWQFILSIAICLGVGMLEIYRHAYADTNDTSVSDHVPGELLIKLLPGTEDHGSQTAVLASL